MNVSSNGSPKNPPESLRETPPDYGFVLPVEPGYRELPPSATWEAGYRLGLAALELVKDRPEIFVHRARCMCDVEFKL